MAFLIFTWATKIYSLTFSDIEKMDYFIKIKLLEFLDLDSLQVNFKLMEDGERVVEMNVVGASMVGRKRITVEYRPRIIGGLKTLLDQLDFFEARKL